MDAVGTSPTRSGSALILDMLARRIPLTLLPDLAWPETLAEPALPHPAGRPPASVGERGRHAAGPDRSESLQQALAFAACPSGRHRRAPAVCGTPATPRAERG
jgi:hypothetical protein